MAKNGEFAFFICQIRHFAIATPTPLKYCQGFNLSDQYESIVLSNLNLRRLWISSSEIVGKQLH